MNIGGTRVAAMVGISRRGRRRGRGRGRKRARTRARTEEDEVDRERATTLKKTKRTKAKRTRTKRTTKTRTRTKAKRTRTREGWGVGLGRNLKSEPDGVAVPVPRQGALSARCVSFSEPFHAGFSPFPFSCRLCQQLPCGACFMLCQRPSSHGKASPARHRLKGSNVCVVLKGAEDAEALDLQRP